MSVQPKIANHLISSRKMERLPGARLFTFILFLLCLGTNWAAESSASSTNRLIVVLGAGGAEEFEREFLQSAEAFERLTNLNALVLGGAKSDHTNALEELRSQIRAAIQKEGSELWLVFIGHGTFDGREPKFNLTGTDLTATELAAMLDGSKRPLILILCFSSSGQFLPKISGKNRIIITATKSGFEQNYSRFGRFFADAWHQRESDLDGDEQISLLEAFIYAASSTKSFYDDAGRIQTEHALIDDNGDQKGTSVTYFIGSSATKKPSETTAADGFFSSQISLQPTVADIELTLAQREERQKLEEKLQELRARKETMASDDYYRELETIMLELSKIYKISGKDSPETNARPATPERIAEPISK